MAEAKRKLRWWLDNVGRVIEGQDGCYKVTGGGALALHYQKAVTTSEKRLMPQRWFEIKAVHERGEITLV